jgi:hypothetical protein
MAVTDIIGFSFFNIVSHNKGHTFPRSQQNAFTSRHIAQTTRTGARRARRWARLVDVLFSRLVALPLALTTS